MVLNLIVGVFQQSYILYNYSIDMLTSKTILDSSCRDLSVYFSDEIFLARSSSSTNLALPENFSPLNSTLTIGLAIAFLSQSLFEFLLENKSYCCKLLP